MDDTSPQMGFWFQLAMKFAWPIWLFLAWKGITHFVPVGLWIVALHAGANVGIGDLLRMRRRKIPPHEIVGAKIKAKKAYVKVDLRRMEDHYLAGGNVEKVIEALIQARSENSNVTLEEVAKSDLAGLLPDEVDPGRERGEGERADEAVQKGRLAERRIGVIAIMGVLGLIVLYAVLRWPLSSTEFGIIITLVSLAVGVFLIVLAVRGWDIDDRERVLLAAAGEGGTQWWRHVRLLRRVVLCVFGGICLLAGLFIGWLVAFHPG